MSCFVCCPKCNRHCRQTESACPFCGAGMAGARCHSPLGAPPARYIKRAALAAAAAASVGGFGCTSSSSSNIVPLYGPAPGWDAYASGGGTGGTEGTGGTGGTAGTKADARPDNDTSSDASIDMASGADNAVSDASMNDSTKRGGD